MTQDEVREVLEVGEQVYYAAWAYSKYYMSCGDGCCDDSLSGVEDAMDTIERACGGRWDEVNK